MTQHTRPAELDPLHAATDAGNPWTPFRVEHPQEQLLLLRQLRDGNVPVILNAPNGSALATTLWAVDVQQQRLNFNFEVTAAQLHGLVDADEAVAVAYLESVKLQFDLHGFVLVRGVQASALQCGLPRDIYRFQRRNAFRVRAPERQQPTAHLRHPALPDMALALRVLDVSNGGCALWLPHDVPPLQAGTLLGQVQLVLDGDTRFSAAVALQHVSALSVGSDGSSRGARLGCEWERLDNSAARTLQRWIDRTQQRRRVVSLGLSLG